MNTSKPQTLSALLSDVLSRARIDCSLDPAWMQAHACDDGIPHVIVCESASLGQKTKIVAKDESSWVLIGERVQLDNCEITVSGPGAMLALASDVKLKNVRIVLKGKGTAVVVGKSTTWVGNGNQLLCESAGTQVVIGDDCMIAHGVVFRTSDGHAIFDRSSREILNKPASISVGAHVWLGNSVRVSKGVRIGEGSIVGQGAIVTGKLDPYCLYVGVPAKKVRSNVTWSRSDHFDGVPPQYR